MAAAFNGYNSYQIEFTATLPGEFDALPGTLIVSGEKYYLDVYDSEIFFDGKDGYTYSESNREVIIETPDPNDTRLFANPAKLFRFYDRDFNTTYSGDAEIAGKKRTHIDLTPRSTDIGYRRVSLWIDAVSGMPTRLSYRLDESENTLIIDVLQIKPNVNTTVGTFRFDPTKHPGIEIIDFR